MRKRDTKHIDSNQFSQSTLQNADQKNIVNIKRKDSEDSEEISEEISDDLSSHPHYKFSYKVFDPDTGDDKEHKEERDGELVQGEYSLVEPDGSRRTVTYISNGTDGFNAIIKKTAAPLSENLEEFASTETDSINEQNSPLEINFESKNSENFTATDTSNNDTVLWFSSKTEYLSPDIMKENDKESNQLVAAESKNYKRGATNNPKTHSPTHFITYSLVVPQILYSPSENLSENMQHNLSASHGTETKTKDKKTRSIQKSHGNKKRRHH
ncbi:uncharacterized protein LOC129608429 [Condylostylus longicornis]|uniref:uncharacterized protein LOC129608429 n=1 Tax=Condylostylus longicornis TaxID=2530218 RepID=UPI00244E449C|nr:uncharacterized protein LOC129608429 [Condylostylus longicornis]